MESLVEHYREEDAKNSNRDRTLEELFPEWLEYKRTHTKAGNYIDRIKRDWLSYYDGTSIIRKPLRCLTKIELDTWAHEMIKRYDMTNKQYYNSTIIMRQALDYAVDLGIIDSNLFRLVRIKRGLFRHIKKAESETQVFTDMERKAMTDLAWDGFRNCAPSRKHKLAPLAMLFMFETGIRIGEALSIRYEDVCRDGAWIHVQRIFRYETKEIVEHTKGSEGDRFVPLTRHAKEIIAAAREKQIELDIPHDGYIFSVNDQPLPYQALQYLYNHYCKKLGIVHKSSHKSRKTYVTTLRENGVSIEMIQKLVGHVDAQTTQNNYCYDRSTDIEKCNIVENALSLN